MRRNFAWGLTGNYLYAACQWALLVVVAKMGTAEMLGQFALGLAIATPILMLTNLQLRTVQANDARGEWAFRECLGTRLVGSATALAAVLILCAVAPYSGETKLVICLAATAKAVESISDVCYGLFQRVERLDLVSRSMMARGIVAVCLVAGILHAGGGMSMCIIALSLGWIAVLSLFDLRKAAALTGESVALPEFKPNRLRALTALALPLGIAMMLGSLNTNIPRYFIQQQFGERLLGIYSAFAYTGVAAVTVVDAMGQSLAPRLAGLFDAFAVAEFRRLCAGFLGLSILLGAAALILAVTAGPWLLTLLYQPEYALHARSFNWVMAAIAVTCVAAMLTYALNSVHEFRTQSPLIAVVIVANAALCWTLIPRYGLSGAGMAGVIAGALQIAGASLLLARVVRRERAVRRCEG